MEVFVCGELLAQATREPRRGRRVQRQALPFGFVVEKRLPDSEHEERK